MEKQKGLELPFLQNRAIHTLARVMISGVKKAFISNIVNVN